MKKNLSLRDGFTGEIEAYKAQYSFDKSFPGDIHGKGIKGIDVHSMGAIKTAEGRPAYDFIYKYSNQLLLEFLLNK